MASLKFLSCHNHHNLLLSGLDVANIALLILSQKATREIQSPAIPCPHPIAGLPPNSKPWQRRGLRCHLLSLATCCHPCSKNFNKLSAGRALHRHPRSCSKTQGTVSGSPFPAMATKSCEHGWGGCCNRRAPECSPVPAVDYYFFLKAHIKQHTTSFCSGLGQHGNSTTLFTIPQALLGLFQVC